MAYNEESIGRLSATFLTTFRRLNHCPPRPRRPRSFWGTRLDPANRITKVSYDSLSSQSSSPSQKFLYGRLRVCTNMYQHATNDGQVAGWLGNVRQGSVAVGESASGVSIRGEGDVGSVEIHLATTLFFGGAHWPKYARLSWLFSSLSTTQAGRPGSQINTSKAASNGTSTSRRGRTHRLVVTPDPG